MGLGLDWGMRAGCLQTSVMYLIHCTIGSGKGKGGKCITHNINATPRARALNYFSNI